MRTAEARQPGGTHCVQVKMLLWSCFLFALQLRLASCTSLTHPEGLLAVVEDVVLLCQAGERSCQSVDPCGGCGSARCSNLDDACLGGGLLKNTQTCSLRWAHVPEGVEVTFYNLWGKWSSSEDDCAEAWSCYSGMWPICLQGSESKERWIGPMSADLEDDRCAVKISIRPGFTCGSCPLGFYRSVLLNGGGVTLSFSAAAACC